MGQQACFVMPPCTDDQHRPLRRLQAFKPRPRARLEAQTAGTVSQRMGTAAQNPQYLLVEVEKSGAHAATGAGA